MKLLTNKNKQQLPPLYTQDGKGQETIAYVKFFCPWNNWTWYATEFDGENEFFGLVKGQDTELGYFYLSDLKSVHKFGLGIERDMHFKPTALKNIK